MTLLSFILFGIGISLGAVAYRSSLNGATIGDSTRIFLIAMFPTTLAVLILLFNL